MTAASGKPQSVEVKLGRALNPLSEESIHRSCAVWVFAHEPIYPELRWLLHVPNGGKRSRGELVLDALDFADARDAVEMLTELDTNAYRPFNMVLADNTQAFWLRNRGAEVEAFPLTPGVTMVTAMDANDPNSKRIRHFLPLWQAAEAPDPDANEWSEWEELLASREHAPDGDAFDAMNIISNTGFGTSSSSIIALPGVQWATRKPIWRFRTGRTLDWQPISL
mgnify:CR=1 FL=1